MPTRTRTMPTMRATICPFEPTGTPLSGSVLARNVEPLLGRAEQRVDQVLEAVLDVGAEVTRALFDAIDEQVPMPLDAREVVVRQLRPRGVHVAGDGVPLRLQ